MAIEEIARETAGVLYLPARPEPLKTPFIKSWGSLYQEATFNVFKLPDWTQIVRHAREYGVGSALIGTTRAQRERAALIYREHHRGYPPDAMFSKANRATASKWVSTLQDRLETPFYYTVHLHAFGLERKARPEFFQDAETIDCIFQAIGQTFEGDKYASLEIGSAYRIHANVIANRQAQGIPGEGLFLPNGKDLITWGKPVYNFPGLARYVLKPKYPSQHQWEGVVILGKALLDSMGKHAPRTARRFISSNLS